MMHLTRREFLTAMTVGAITAASRAAGLQVDRPRLVLLGTGGGPSPKALRSAPAQAIVVNGQVYVIDCGDGVARQMVLAGLDVTKLRAIFITHQHSDHNADYGNLVLLGWTSGLKTPVDAYGPPPLETMTKLFMEMNRYDIETRIADEGRPALLPLLVPHELERAGPVMQDASVKVTSTLVRHPPVTPAFAYRFDAPNRSFVISGDTAPSDNLIQLATGADVLVHEVMYVPAIGKMVAARSDATRLREHLMASHTAAEDAGRVASASKVKTLVLSHYVPGDDASLTEALWIAAARLHFSGEIIAGRDLMTI